MIAEFFGSINCQDELHPILWMDLILWIRKGFFNSSAAPNVDVLFSLKVHFCQRVSPRKLFTPHRQCSFVPNYLNNVISRFSGNKRDKCQVRCTTSLQFPKAVPMFTFSHRRILCCVLLSEGGKLPAVVRELAKRIWRVLIDVDNVDVDIRRDFPANRSLFVYTSGCIYPSGCCRNEVEEDSVVFHLPHLCPHVYYSGRRRTVWMRSLGALHSIYLLCFIYLKRSHPSMHMHPKCKFIGFSFWSTDG